MHLSPRKYLVLLAIIVFGTFGDLALKQGMNQVGEVPLQNLDQLIGSILNPWVAAGIVTLLAFFAAYLTALSWADLTYVLPATSFGYVLIALFSQLYLHEDVDLTRWLGILLITSGVGFVTRGPASTDRRLDLRPGTGGQP
jgi:uncharacterized membrane protein